MFENLQRFLAEALVNRLTPKQQEVSLREIRERMMRHTLAANRLQADLFDQALVVLRDKYHEAVKSNRQLYLGNSASVSKFFSPSVIELRYEFWSNMVNSYGWEVMLPDGLSKVAHERCYIKVEEDKPLSDTFRAGHSLVISKELNSDGGLDYKLARGWEGFNMASFLDELRPFPYDSLKTRGIRHFLHYGLINDPKDVHDTLERIINDAPKWRPVKLTPV